jgi:hypothetical protein
MKKLETVFSVFLVGVLLVPGLSFGQWVGPTAPFSVSSPNPDLPITEGSAPQGKSANISVPQINISGDAEYVSKTSSTDPQFNSILLGPNRGLFWISGGSGYSLKVSDTGFFNFFGEGIKLPSKATNPSSPVSGTIYYDSNAKEVKLYDGTTWKSIGSGTTGTAVSTGGNFGQWLNTVNGGIYYSSFSNPIDNPHHGSSAISNDPVTVNQYCKEDVVPVGKYVSGEVVDVLSNYVSNSTYYNGTYWTGPGSANVVSRIICHAPTSNPKVGIEKNNPAYTLDVNGTVNASNYLLNGTALPSSQWINNGAKIYYNNGNVGMGNVNDPAEALEVGGDPGRIRISANTGNSELQLRYGGGVNDHWAIFADRSTKNLNIWSQDFLDGTHPADTGTNVISITPSKYTGLPAKLSVNGELCLGGVCKLAWDTNSTASQWKDGTAGAIYYNGGNVGIGGVPDVAYSFDVKSGKINLGDAGSEVFMPGGGTLDNGLLIRSGGLDVKSNRNSVVSSSTHALSVGGEDVRLYVNAMNSDPWGVWAQVLSDSGAKLPLALNPNGGNVGIGTNNPTQKLDINGGSLLVRSGNIYFESPVFANAPSLSGIFNDSNGSLPQGEYYYALTYGGLDGGGETQASGFTSSGASVGSGGNGRAIFDIAEPSDSRIGSFYIYRAKGSGANAFPSWYKRIGIWNLPKSIGQKVTVGQGTLEKTSIGYKFTDSGLPPGSAGLPPYPTFSAGFMLKSEQEGGYRAMLNFVRQSGENKTFVGLNTDRPSQMFEILGIGSVSSAEASNVLDTTDGKTARLRITDTGANPELQLQYGTNPNDHWGIYASKINGLSIWGGSNSTDIIKISNNGDVKIENNISVKNGISAKNASYTNNPNIGGYSTFSIIGGGANIPGDPGIQYQYGVGSNYQECSAGTIRWLGRESFICTFP